MRLAKMDSAVVPARAVAAFLPDSCSAVAAERALGNFNCCIVPDYQITAAPVCPGLNLGSWLNRSY